jgi:branched-chain amino acid transport system ATP-binding protein
MNWGRNSRCRSFSSAARARLPRLGLTREEREDLDFYIIKAKQNLDMAIIWIEHDMRMVADLADRIHVLDYGRSLADGFSEEVFRDKDVIRAYLGTADGSTQ